MTLRDRLIRRMGDRKLNADDWVIAAALKPGRKRSVIARQIANSVMPRRIVLQSGQHSLAMDVGHRRICAAIFRSGQSVTGSFDFTNAMADDARSSFDDALSELVGTEADLTLEFLPSEKSYPEAVGVEPETVLSDDGFEDAPSFDAPELEAAKTPAPAARAGGAAAAGSDDAPAAQKTASPSDAPLAARDRAESAAPKAAAKSDAPSAVGERTVEVRGKVNPERVHAVPAAADEGPSTAAARFRDLARGHAERVAGFAGDLSAAEGDAELSPECSEAFREFRENARDALGDDILCIVVPEDGATQYVVALSEDGGSAANFKANRLARILKAWDSSQDEA